jgi:hypothetical protein
VVITQGHIGGGAERKGANARYSEVFIEREKEGHGAEKPAGSRGDLCLTQNETNKVSESHPTPESKILTGRSHNP